MLRKYLSASDTKILREIENIIKDIDPVELLCHISLSSQFIPEGEQDFNLHLRDEPILHFLAGLCLKEGKTDNPNKKGLQAEVKPEWFQNCGDKFLKPLIDIVHPKAIIPLGLEASLAVIKAYNLPIERPKRMRDLVEAGSILLPEGIKIFPVYHCGAGISNRTRKLEDQFRDWERIVWG